MLKTGTVLSIPEEEIDTRLQGKRMLHTRKVPVLDDSAPKRLKNNQFARADNGLPGILSKSIMV